MNILILSGLSGGVGTHVKDLVHMLVEHNVNPYVIALSDPQRDKEEEKAYYTQIDYSGYFLLDISHLGEAAFNYILQNRVDLVHAHFLAPPGYCALQLKQFWDIPYVITLHGDDVHYMCQNLAFKEQSKIILSNASKVITVSNSLANDVKTLNIDSSKLIVIPNIVDMVAFNPNIDGGIIRDRYKIYDPIILYAGRLWYNKGLHILLLAFNKLLKDNPRVKLMIVGDGFIRDELLRIARHLKIDDKVLFTGNVPHGEMPLYMAACDIFALSSVSEGQPIVTLEAMSCAKPVVATTAGGIPEVVINGENGYLVDLYDVVGFSKALKILIENEDLRKKLGLKGRKIVEEKYNSHDITNQILNTYTEAIITKLKAANHST